MLLFSSASVFVCFLFGSLGDRVEAWEDNCLQLLLIEDVYINTNPNRFLYFAGRPIL
jgi:hypothetical protein